MFCKFFLFFALIQLFQYHVESSSILTIKPTELIFDDTTVREVGVPTAAESSMTVSGLSSTLSSTAVITLQIWFTHTYNGDCTIRLYAPDGNYITLSERRGGSYDNIFDGTIFSDSASNSVATYTFTKDGVVTPLKPENPFTTFRGKAANGVWKVWILDQAGGDSGYLNRVRLTISGMLLKKNKEKINKLKKSKDKKKEKILIKTK